MPTDVQICTAALLMVGADEITSFSDETREAKICNELYPTLVEDLITDHPWRFTMAQEELAQLEDEPLYGYEYAYQLPSNLLQLKSVRYFYDYKIFENHLYSNASEMFATFQFYPVEARWPSYFVKLVELELAAILSVALSEDKVKAELFTNLADRQRRKARNKDSQQQPNGMIPEHNHVLTQVRY